MSLLESQGFEVDDLGVDVAIESVAEAAGEADAVCLSALMTTTLPAMEKTVAEVERVSPGTPVLVGGAVVTRAVGALDRCWLLRRRARMRRCCSQLTEGT